MKILPMKNLKISTTVYQLKTPPILGWICLNIINVLIIAHSILLDPRGSLSAIVPYWRIEEVNITLKAVIEEQIDDKCSTEPSRRSMRYFC